MSIKFIHAADVHLDSAFSGLSDVGKSAVRREDMRTSFSRVISLAKDTDFLVISGDLFDGQTVSRTTLDFLKQQFARMFPKPVFICAGNHDCFTRASVYETFDFGENVHIFSIEGDCVQTENADIYGISFSSANDERNLLSKIHIQNPDKLNLLVMHANLAGEGYNPLRLTEIAESGMDYIALGHIHASSGLLKSGRTYYAYPGCTEGRGFDETGEKGVFCVTLDKGEATAEWISVQERMYLEETVDVTGAEDYEAILEAILKKTQGARHIYRINLVGTAQFPFDTAVLLEKLEGFSVTVRDKTTPALDLKQLAKEFTLKGLFAKFAMEDRGQMSEEAFALAVKTGLSLIEKEERNEN